MGATLDQFIAFTTDAVGIERILRLVQALAQVFATCTLPFELLLTVIAAWTGREASPELTLATLVAVKQRFNLARRFFRVFRFVEAFRDAQRLYTSSTAGQKKSSSSNTAGIGADVWLDIFGKTFNGMYLLLETTTFLEVLDIDGLAVWDAATRSSINVEAQRFWLFALVCGTLSGLWRMFCIKAYSPVPQTLAIPTNNDSIAEKEEDSTGEEEKEDAVADSAAALRKEQARLRQGGAQDREAHRRAERVKMYKLGRGAAANAFDAAIPGVIVGWLDLSEAAVGQAMVVSTVLTGLAVWEKCGAQVGA